VRNLNLVVDDAVAPYYGARKNTSAPSPATKLRSFADLGLRVQDAPEYDKDEHLYGRRYEGHLVKMAPARNSMKRKEHRYIFTGLVPGV
jgi:hypothetical protein